MNLGPDEPTNDRKNTPHKIKTSVSTLATTVPKSCLSVIKF